MHAVGFDLDKVDYSDFCKMFPILSKPIPLSEVPNECPEFWSEQRVRMDMVIGKLNDVLHWPRERIADWVELQEELDTTDIQMEVEDARGEALQTAPGRSSHTS
jgi:hypothetical protein